MCANEHNISLGTSDDSVSVVDNSKNAERICG